MDLAGFKVAIIATDMFEDAELFQPRQTLESAGAEVSVVAPHDGEIQGVEGDTKKTRTISVDETLDTASPDDYDGVLLPGGSMNADRLRIDQNAQAFIREIEAAGKPIAVICHGPWLLVSAGLVEGRTLTSFPTLADDIENAGGIWEDEVVVCDGNWVSSRKPDDIPVFSKAMLKLFGEHRD